ncbi:hypothetical protein J3A78_002719 [Streptomyces sp. PvR006]|nr:hypothetical protein [Streptomyces sp. PvR006]
MWPTARDTLLYTSPNGLCGAEWARAACSFERGDLPVAWQIAARSHSGSTLPEWNAYFTSGVPHETLTDLLLALDARTEPAFCFDGFTARRAALTSARRSRGAAHRHPPGNPATAKSTRTGVSQGGGRTRDFGKFSGNPAARGSP